MNITNYTIFGRRYGFNSKLMEGLVAYYPLENNAQDVSGNSNQGVPTNLTYTTGKIGLAGNFSDSKYVTLPTSSDFSFTDGTNDLPFSFSAWVRLTNQGTNMILSKNTPSANSEWLFFTYNLGGAVTNLRLAVSNINQTAYLQIEASNTLTANIWYHVVGTYDGSKTSNGLKLYINGVLQSVIIQSAGTYTGMQFTTVPALIGGRSNQGSTEGFDGDIEEVGIWKNIALNQADVNELYNANIGRTFSFNDSSLLKNLVAYYPFDYDNSTVYGPKTSTIGSPTYSIGKIKQGINFGNNSDSNYLEMPPINEFSFTNGGGIDTPFSIGLWINISSYSNDGNWLISKRGTTGNEYDFIIYANRLSLYKYSSTENNYQGIQAPPNQFAFNTWYYVVATDDGSKTNAGMKLYINGVQMTTTNDNAGSYTGMVKAVVNLRLGQGGNTVNTNLKHRGLMDELAIWKGKTLTQSEINELYNGGKGNAFPFLADGYILSATTSSFGSLSLNGEKYSSGVLAPNGKIYGMPSLSSGILIIDPNTKTTSTFGNTGGGYRYGGITLAPNGKLYVTPADTSQILVIDPNNNTTYTFTYAAINGLYKTVGAILTPNGKIYAIPSDTSQILVVDPSNDTSYAFGSFGNASNKWNGGALAFNGKIYCTPFASTQILVIDPSNDTTYYFGDFPNVTFGGNKWRNGVLAPNGKIYCIPVNSTNVLVIDPSNDTTYVIPNIPSGANKWNSGVLAPNGKIYCLPFSGTKSLMIDPSNDTFSLILNNTMLTDLKWSDNTLGPDGKIYGVPYQAGNIGLISGIESPDLIGNDRFIPNDLSTLATSNYNKFYNK